MRYFANFIGRCLLPKVNATNTSTPDIYVLYSALTGDRTYDLGAIIARHINAARTQGDICCGFYATLVAEYMEERIRHNIDRSSS